MSIEKGIRAFSTLPPPLIEEDIETPEGNKDLGFLDTASRRGDQNSLTLKTQSYPDRLTLRARLEPVLRDKAAVAFRISINGKASPAQDFYGKKVLEEKQKGYADYSQHKALRMLYANQGSFRVAGEEAPLSTAPFQLSLKTGGGEAPLRAEACLLQKEFLVQERSTLHQRQTYLNDGQWLISPPYGPARINAYPLMAYGGYLKPGLPLNRITQIFAVLTRRRESDPATIVLRSQKELELQRVPPPQPGYLDQVSHHYIDAFRRTHLANLTGHIEGGASRLTLTLLEEEENTPLPELTGFQESESSPAPTQEYRSYGYTQSDPASGFVDLHYRPVL